jgi:hypothetical protein
MEFFMNQLRWAMSAAIVVGAWSVLPSSAWASAPQDAGSIQLEVAPSQQLLTVRPNNHEFPWLFDIGVRSTSGVFMADLGLGGHIVNRPIFALWSDVRFGPRMSVRDGLIPGLGMRASLLPGWRKGFFRFYAGAELDLGFMSAAAFETRASPLFAVRLGGAFGPVDVWLSGAIGYSFGGYDVGSIRYDGSFALAYRWGKRDSKK